MAYIGPAPNPGQNREVDDISGSFNGSTTAFTLQVNSQNVSPGSPNAIVVSLGGVVQNPGTDYNIAASTITFTTAPASGLSFFGLVLGQQIDTQSLADGASPTMSAPSITGDLSIADKIVHSGDTDTAIRFSAADTVSVETGGSQKLSLGAATVFNESGANVDFRIEGDTDTNLFNLDASADAIGIGGTPGTTGMKMEIFRSTTDAFVNASDCVLRLLNTDTSANTNQTSLQFTTSTTGSGADSAIVSKAEDASGNSRLQFWTDTSNGMTEKMAILASGSVRVGEDGTFTADTGADDLVVGNANSGVNRGLSIYNHTGSDGRICFAQSGDPDAGMIKYSHGSDVLQFFSEGDELVRLKNTSSQTEPTMEIRKPNGASNVQSHMIHLVVGGHDRGALIAGSSFGASAIVGSSSDYRIKTNIRDYTGGWNNIKALPVKIFDINLKGEEATDVKGWIAHEVQAVIPEAVTGTKDATKDILYTEGDTLPEGKSVGDVKETVPDYQSLGYNVFMPDVVSALQTAMAKIETLETKVAALEAA